MEVGEHCAFRDCNRLDFLPLKCSSCRKNFCGDHYLFDNHSCPEPPSIDRQVPLCPICDKPVSYKVGESLDYAVNQHIEQNCSTNKEKVFKHRCHAKDCKKRELIQLDCDVCKKNHCIKHRHPKDHDCTGPPPKQNTPNFFSSGFFSNSISSSRFSGTPSSSYVSSHSGPSMFANTKDRATKAVTSLKNMFQGGGRNTNPQHSQRNGSSMSQVANVNNGLSEEEALNIAIAQSLSIAEGSGKK